MKILLYGDVFSALDMEQAALIASVEEMPQGRASDMGSPPCCLKYATKQKHIHIITLHLTLDIIIHVPHNISQYTSLLFTKFAKPGSV